MVLDDIDDPVMPLFDKGLGSVPRAAFLRGLDASLLHPTAEPPADGKTEAKKKGTEKKVNVPFQKLLVNIAGTIDVSASPGTSGSGGAGGPGGFDGGMPAIGADPARQIDRLGNRRLHTKRQLVRADPRPQFLVLGVLDGRERV